MSTQQIEESLPNRNLAKAVMALIGNRKRILSKSFSPYASFFIGNTTIQLGLREVIIGDVSYKLPKPKDDTRR